MSGKPLVSATHLVSDRDPGEPVVTDSPIESAAPGDSSTSTPSRSVGLDRWTLLALVGLLIAGAAVRVVLWEQFRDVTPQITDELDYIGLAGTLVGSGEFGFAPGRPVSIRPPLYPAIVAGVYRVLGPENHEAVRALQAALGLVNVGLVFALAWVVGRKKSLALIASALCCGYPSLIGFEALILTETLFTVLLTAAVLAVCLGLDRDRLAWLALGGTLIGLAALTRSALWPFPPVLAAYLLVAWRGPVRRRIVAALVVGVTAYLVIAPWAIRNTRLQGTLTVVDCMGGRNFMMGNYEFTPLYRTWDAISIQGERSWDAVLRNNDPEAFVAATQGQRDKLAMRHGFRYVLDHPLQTLQRSAVKSLHFWNLERTLVAGLQRGYFGPAPRHVVLGAAALVCGAYAVVILTAIFGGFVRSWPEPRTFGLLVLMTLYLWALHAVTFGHPRYHLPLIPLLVVLAAGACVDPQALWARRRSLRFALSALIALVLVGSWAWDLVSSTETAMAFGSSDPSSGS